MQTFINDVVNDILSKTKNLSDHTFVLPSRRAGVFLKDQLKLSLKSPTILPKVISIEEFIAQLSSINLIDTTTLLFEFYFIYTKHTPTEKRETFDQFSTWATILLQDFNEIDQHLINPTDIFIYFYGDWVH